MARDHEQPDTPVTVLILAATRPELQAAAGKLGLAASGVDYASVLLDTGRIAFGTMGVGPTRAAGGSRRLIEQFRPQRVLLAGFAGALDPARRIGQVLQLRHTRQEDGRIIHLDGPVPRMDPGRVDVNDAYTVVSVDELAYSADEKRRLFEKHHAACVDMESFHVAQVCMELGLPLVIVRAISDGHDQALPAAASQWIDERGRVRNVAILAYLASHPSAFPMFVRLAKSSHKAGAALGVAVKQVLGPLFPPGRKSLI